MMTTVTPPVGRANDPPCESPTIVAKGSNPLLTDTFDDHASFFETLQPDHIVAGVRTLVLRLRSELVLAERAAAPLWKATVGAIDDLTEPLSRAWGWVTHMLRVMNTPELRAAHAQVQEEVVAALTTVRQSAAFNAALDALKEGGAWHHLDGAQRRVVDTFILEARCAGATLSAGNKSELVAIEAELARLATAFRANVMAAQRAFELILHTPRDAAGLAPGFLSTLAPEEADPRRGPWRITLEAAKVRHFMAHSTRRDLRERAYRASISLAASAPYDNRPVIARMLELRHEKARLLGFGTYASLSLTGKVVNDVVAVDAFLTHLRDVVQPAARRELEWITDYARNASPGRVDALAPWDVPFWSRQLREELYGYSEDEVREYLTLDSVLEGTAWLGDVLFGVLVVCDDNPGPMWHASVRHLRVLDPERGFLGSIYLDPHARPGMKAPGAWTYGMRSRKLRSDGTIRSPIACVVCNFSPTNGSPPTLSLKDAGTLFHEFGHALQNVLTTVDYPEAAGSNNIELDAIEFPSTFMELWCYTPDVLRRISRHQGTGRALPTALIEKISSSRQHGTAMQLLAQIHLATLDLELHRQPVASAIEVQRRVASMHSVLPSLPEDSHVCSFRHIFCADYAAAFYAYCWSDMLSADAFAAFLEAARESPSALAATGLRFRRTVLEKGGGTHPLEVFSEFRGRQPKLAAMLEQRGLTPHQQPT